MEDDRCLQQPRYSWQQHQRLGDKEEAMENRRTELLERLQSGPDANVTREMLEEWICLLEERNVVLHKRIEEEQNIAKTTHLHDLYRLLQDLGTLPFSPKETKLKRSLACLYHEMSAHNSIHTTENRMRSLSAPEVIPQPPPPPPLPPSLSFLQAAKAQNQPHNHTASSPSSDKENDKLATRTMDSRVTNLQTPFRSNAPVRGHDDMIKFISSTDCRKSLRQTKWKRSPGGTPAPNKHRRLSANTEGDLLAQALHKKFRLANRSPAISEKTENSFNSPSSVREPLGCVNNSMTQMPLSSTPKLEISDDHCACPSLPDANVTEKNNREEEIQCIVIQTI